MKMGEFDITALGLPADYADFFDKEMPGWRDMDMLEFADELPKFHEQLRREGQLMIEIARKLAEGDES